MSHKNIFKNIAFMVNKLLSTNPSIHQSLPLTIVLLSIVLLSAPIFAEDYKPVWQAKPPKPDAKMEKLQNVRIVDYGDDFVYHGAGGFRDRHKRRSEYAMQYIKDTDVNNDGVAEGDCIAYLKYSLDVPLSISQPHWDPEGNNSVFYGGITGFFANNKNKGGFTELKVNSFETPDGDNITMMVHGTKEWNKFSGLWLWKKEDFYSSGNKNRVSLDDTSWIGVHCMRGWVGMDQARFVLRDGQDQFYISEYNFGDFKAQKAYAGSKGGIVYSICPDKTRWAKYDPKEPYHIVFDSEKAVYKKHKFNDVQVAGYYIARHKGAATTLDAKMYAFELFGTVHRPERGSESLKMAKLKGDNKTPPFYISKTEIPYALWRKIRRWAVSQQWGREDYKPYMTGDDGDMGSMDYAPDGKLLPHNTEEPVTNMRWLDAVAWCNMLSEFEGRTPVYYYDKEKTVVFRWVVERRSKGRNRMGLIQQKAYVKWDADGYRLPTADEWLLAKGKNFKADSKNAWLANNSGGTTHPVAAKQPNANGIFDIYGNVWEYIWDVDGPFIQEFIDRNTLSRYKGPHIVLGGGRNTKINQKSKFTIDDMKQASIYGDKPFYGFYNIGFRIVRRNTGLKKPAVISAEKLKTNVPSWKISFDDHGKTQKLKEYDKPLLNMVEVPEGHYKRCDLATVFVSPFWIAKTEVTYAQWKKVYDWAIKRGYDFNKDGDMGSMDRESDGKTYSPNEPVTDIPRCDAIIFCNALSEMEGKIPVYQTSTKILRKSTVSRKHWVKQPKDNKYHEKNPNYDEWNRMFKGYGDSYGMPGNFNVNWAADGYRLPTKSEWSVAYNGKSIDKYYWGNNYGDVIENAWMVLNSNGKTHPVGGKKSNSLGLFDMAGNVWEYCNGRSAVAENQAFHETWNPKGTTLSRSYGIFGQIMGGSFEVSAKKERSFRPLASGREDRWVHTPLMKGYPVVGFRPVRCKLRTHRSSGSEMPEKIQVLDINLQEAITPLQGATHRANLQRTGVLYSEEIKSKPKEIWQFKTGGEVRGQPIVYRGTAYIFSGDKYLYAIDAETGEEKWKFKTNGGPMSKKDKDIRPPAPTIKDNLLYLGDNGGYVYAIDIKTGRPKWSTTARGARRVSGSPVPVYGAVFTFLTSYIRGEGGIMAIHGETGQLLNIYKNQPWGPYQTWAFTEGNLLMSNHVAGSKIDLKTGSKSGYGQSSWHSNYNIPVVYKGSIYLVGLALGRADYRSGKPVYYLPIEGDRIGVYGGSIAQREAVSDNTLAIWDDKVYFGSRNGKIYCRNISGKRIWETTIGKRVRCAPVVCTETPNSKNAVVYAASAAGNIVALDANTGAILWELNINAEVEADPWIVDGILYVADNNGILHAFQ